MRGFIGVIAACVGACGGTGAPDDFTLGEQGRVEFELTRPDLDWNTSAIDAPLLVGSTEYVDAYSHERDDNEQHLPIPPVGVTSSDPDVLAVSSNVCCKHGDQTGGCGYTYDECAASGGEVYAQLDIEIRVLAEGHARIVLYTVDDPTYDVIELDARRARSLELQVSADGGESFTPTNTLELDGSHARVRAIGRDADGNALLGRYGIEMSLAHDIASFQGKYESTNMQDYTSTFSVVWPQALGGDTLTLRAGELTAIVPVASR